MPATLVPVLIVRADPARPTHIHTCLVDGDQGHQWECTSPYCERMIRHCEEHDGQTARETQSRALHEEE